MLLQITDNAIQKPNSPARTASVSRNCGCATSTTIVAMIVTNQHLCVVNKTVQLVGNGVLVMQTIVASPSGSSATAKTIVETVQTRDHKTVRPVISKRTSSVPTTGVSLNNGFATLLRIVAMEVTKLMSSAKIVTESVPNRSSNVRTENVLLRDGVATWKMTVVITAMRWDVVLSFARYLFCLLKNEIFSFGNEECTNLVVLFLYRMIRSNVPAAIVSRLICVATGLAIVAT